MDWAEGDLVWFDPGMGHPIPGEIQEVHRAAQVIVVQALIKGKPQTFALQPGEGSLRARQDLGSSGVEDMTLLDDLHEASLLWNLRLRYDKGLIYTFAGSILIAVNPYKMFPDAYGLEVAKQYAGRPLGSLPPHLFAIGAAAHAALPSPQVVVISGESGSGKTESTKLVMQYLAAVVPGGGSASAVITEQILEAAPLLEAFGNARTARNDNSSRFGKYLEVYFKSGAIVGAKITQYLLEKSRIVTQAPGERNYHVFYELLGGLSETERAKYGLLEADKYFYLNQGATDCASGRVDWESLQGAMQVLGVSEGEREGIVRVLAAVLHLGNVYFHRRQLRHGQEGVEVGSDAEIKWAAHLLHISAEGLHRALTSRTTEARAERLHTPLGIDQALDARDAFAKALYAGLFNWLVSRINSIVQKGGTHDAHRISILDIFGFEDLAENSFEQLCINYANENLQLYFNKHVFKLEQAEYARERLEWTPLAWDDNLPVIHLLAKKPVGICHLLDDESNFPRATDLSFLEKCHYNHALSELYARPRIGAQEFGVTHYAGQVWYCVDGFLDKNRDALRGDVLELLASSRLPLVGELTKQLRAQRDAGKTLPKGSNGRFVTMKPRTPTVAARFADSLQQLLQSMGRCHPWFVRCIKPNQEKHALRMDMPCVLQQLRYLGMLDTIQIRQRGYPVRLRFQHFVERYRHLLASPLARGTPYRELCRALLEAMPRTGVEGPDYQLGATRVFLREALHRALESGRTERLRRAAVSVQRHVRGMLVRRQLARRQAAATRLQARWRGQRAQQRFDRLRRGALTAQRLWRGRQARRRVHQLRSDHRRRQEAREAAQRAREAREAKQAVLERSQLSYLDIPAELAFIYSKLQGWSPPHGDRHLVKVLGTVPGPPPSAVQLPEDLGQFSFGKFSSVYCNGLRLQPRREPITAPLLTRAASRDQDFQDALAVFKLILRWSNDKALEGAKEKLLADYIVHKALSSRGLRDEILVQLCNQVHGLPPTSVEATRLWQLLGQCLCCFQPSAAFSKYLMRFVDDEAPASLRPLLLRQLLRQQGGAAVGGGGASRSFVPAWLEWRAWTRGCDMALPLTLPDEASQTVAVDSWTSCEEAAALAVASLGVASRGWTLVLDDGQQLTDSCGLDYVMDLIAEKELCPAFPAPRSDLLRSGAKFARTALPEAVKRPAVPPPAPPTAAGSGPAKEEVPRERRSSRELLSRSSALNERYFEREPSPGSGLGAGAGQGSGQGSGPGSSAAKSRSKSLDDLLAGDIVPVPPDCDSQEPLHTLGLSESRLNDRYHSAERLAPMGKESAPRYQKSQHAGRRSHAASHGSHSSKYADKAEYATRSSAMSDTSEAPSLASHVRRVRVPSQASDVDQFLDDLFSPVLDGSLDELSDARSLAASIRGGGGCYPLQQEQQQEQENESESEIEDLDDYINEVFQPIALVGELEQLASTDQLAVAIKGGGNDFDDYMDELFEAMPVAQSLDKLVSKEQLALSIRGGGSTDSNGGDPLLHQLMQLPGEPESGPALYQQQVQRAFLQSAMAQNLQIQQQLLAQNQALQTLLSQQASAAAAAASNSSAASPPPAAPAVLSSLSISPPPPPLQQAASPLRLKTMRSSLVVMEALQPPPPPPPPPMPPPLECKDPSETRHFLDPYGRAKTVRIGKWRWPPPQDEPQFQTEEDFFAFKMRQHQRKTTPQAQHHQLSGNSNGLEPSAPGARGSSATAIEWEEFEIESPTPPPPMSGQLMRSSIRLETTTTMTSTSAVRDSRDSRDGQDAGQQPMQSVLTTKLAKKSFEIGADRPPPGSVGKLKLSSEMRQRLEQVTAGHSVRSTVSTKSEQRAPAKLEDTRKLMLQQQLGGLFASVTGGAGGSGPGGGGGGGGGIDSHATVRTQIERMEGKLSPPPAPPSGGWPGVLLPPAPSVPAPPPPIRPPSMAPPAPPPAPQSPPTARSPEPEPDYRTSASQAAAAKEHVPAFIQRQERDTFGAVRQHQQHQHQQHQQHQLLGSHHHLHLEEHSASSSSPAAAAWDQAERERSRSRSRSRDREDYSESVWDRAEVEGPASGSGSEKEREKRERERERLYEIRQVERERESHKVYQPAPPRVIQASLDTTGGHRREDRAGGGLATFRTHMAQKYEHERKRKSSASSGMREELDSMHMTTPPPVIVPAPVPPPTITSQSSPGLGGAGASSACLTYNRVPWKLRVRKEVFQPHEPIGPPVALDLLFAQVLGDVFGVTPCLRITPQEKSSALNMLHGHGVSVDTLSNRNGTGAGAVGAGGAGGGGTGGQVRALVKRHLVDMARDWPLYFARLFAVQGAPLYPDVSIMGVSHSGLYLARRDADYLIVVQAISFGEIQSAVTLPRPAALQLNLRNGKHLALHAARAAAIQSMVTGFVHEFRKSQSKASTLSSGARAAAQTLNVPLERLESRQAHAQRNEHGVDGGGSRQNESLQQADLHHHLQHHSQQQQQQQFEDALEEQQMAADHQQQQQQGQIQGQIQGQGQGQGQQQRFLKQQSYLHSARKSNAGQQPSSLTNGQVHQQEQILQQQQQQSQSLPHHDLDANYLAEEANGGTPPSVTKYSLLQFAMQHFRNDQLRDADRHHERHQSAANRSYAELVKWQGHAIRLPLLRLPNDLAPLALECFDCILRYCGDIPLDPDLTEVKCVYTVLMHCHKYLALRDEVYCQLMKQTTANRSPCPDSSQRAWRLLSILAAYFGCSDALRPYLMEHLTSAASDRRRSCHGTAAVCLTNLRKTARCGGRKNVPSVEEVTAVSAGRSARRQIYRLPGGAERVVNTRCSTVVADVIAELCALLGVESEAEQQEFSLYCIVQGDAFTMPLAADEYILDVTTELLKSGQPFYLIFCRSVWHFALKREPAPMPLYVEVLFNQVAPDYLEGLLLELPGNGVPVPEMVRDMARIAALLHRAADLSHVPAMKEIKFLLPKPALGIREIRPAQWVGLVQSAWPQVASLSPSQVKAQFLNVLATWPLFGSSFFAVKRIWAEEGPHVEDNHSPMWRDLILALNRRGVLFLDPNTHETLQHWSFMEVISTRKVRSEDGALFLDMKVGNLMQQRVIRVQTEQAHEISRLVRQYITMAQISQRDKRELN
ncbi:LOW QUALITY PROTEIN: unconventional myosin-XV [Drosophila gunungcola]|uniref:LOW QUALITY PROTEIN: unconventional myosin-XV n=1 Tax=Drosophila gunungcola TaxID=103775 RepID=UPI0022E78BDA|nr:LOW QUALITY PROTEIN: unconventional myosin-XV [Drosophila gunungcola]